MKQFFKNRLARLRAAKLLLLRRRTLAFIAAAAAVCALFAAVQYPAAVTSYAAERQLPIYCVERDQKICSISFDAACGAGKMRALRAAAR